MLRPIRARRAGGGGDASRPRAAPASGGGGGGPSVVRHRPREKLPALPPGCCDWGELVFAHRSVCAPASHSSSPTCVRVRNDTSTRTMSDPSSEDPSSGGEGSGSGGGGGGGGGGPGNKDSKLYEKPSGGKKKLLRLLTVLAYVMSVSMAAIMLSLYYVFLWDPHGTGPRYGRHVVDPPPHPNYTQDGSAPQFQPLHQPLEASSNITSNLTSLVSSPPVSHTAMNQTASEQLAT